MKDGGSEAAILGGRAKGPAGKARSTFLIVLFGVIPPICAASGYFAFPASRGGAAVPRDTSLLPGARGELPRKHSPDLTRSLGALRGAPLTKGEGSGVGAILAPSDSRLLVSLTSLVPAGDPLAGQDLVFDARFAALALDFFRTGDARFRDEIALLPATAHLLAHARNFDYDVPKDSPGSLVASLLSPATEKAKRISTCRESLAFFTGPMLDDPHWVSDALRYLPDSFRFRGNLFLTFGYDIGVAFSPNASLNGAQRHFDGHPRELLYYAIHELHHAGFMSLRPPPRWPDLKTCRDLLAAVQYHTQLEGMAVLAAWDWRRATNALNDDADYVALQDGERMPKDTAAYFRDYDHLAGRGDQPLDAGARAVTERMSGERLWYRVGALLARRIEESRGRAALIALVGQDPALFIEAARPLMRTLLR